MKRPREMGQRHCGFYTQAITDASNDHLNNRDMSTPAD